MRGNVQVFLEVAIGSKTGGTIVFELFNDVAPRSVHNFAALCTGEYGKAMRSGLPLCYKGCQFFKIEPGVMVQSGDFEYNNGEGGESVFGGMFRNESMLRRHCQAGVLSMVSNDSKENGSQFIVTLRRAPQFDGKHIVFGQVIQGMDVLRAIEKCPIDANNSPRVPIVIVNCGVQPRLPGMRRNDPKKEMREAVSMLMASLNPSVDATTKKISDAQKGLQKLQKVLEESKIKASPASADLSKHEITPQTSDGSTTIPRYEHDNQKDNNTVSLHTDGVSALPDVERPQSQALPNAPSRFLHETIRSSYLTEGDESTLTPQEKKLRELRRRLEEGRHLNTREVAMEKSAQSHPKSFDTLVEQNKTVKELRKVIYHTVGDTTEHGLSDTSVDTQKDKRPHGQRKKKLKGAWSNNEPADVIQWRDHVAKKKASNADKAFGWDVINSDASFRAYKKRTSRLQLHPDEYAKQIIELGEDFYDPTATLVSADFRPTEEAKNRFVAAIMKDKAQSALPVSCRLLSIFLVLVIRCFTLLLSVFCCGKAWQSRCKAMPGKSFSRRRTYIEGETVAYVNDFNRSFNQKLERAYGAYSAEIRQNLERGTAI